MVQAFGIHSIKPQAISPARKLLLSTSTSLPALLKKGRNRARSVSGRIFLNDSQNFVAMLFKVGISQESRPKGRGL